MRLSAKLRKTMPTSVSDGEACSFSKSGAGAAKLARRFSASTHPATHDRLEYFSGRRPEFLAPEATKPRISACKENPATDRNSMAHKAILVLGQLRAVASRR